MQIKFHISNTTSNFICVVSCNYKRTATLGNVRCGLPTVFIFTFITSLNYLYLNNFEVLWWSNVCQVCITSSLPSHSRHLPSCPPPSPKSSAAVQFPIWRHSASPCFQTASPPLRGPDLACRSRDQPANTNQRARRAA